MSERNPRAAAGSRRDARRRGADAGFSLIEFAAVLVIGGFVLIAIAGLRAQTDATDREASTLQKIDVAQAALEAFFFARGRLPCPSNGEFAPSDPYFGREAISVVGCDTTRVPEDRAVLPWRTLALSDRESLDGWGHRLRYRVSEPFLTDDASSAAGDLEVRDREGSTIASNAAYVLFSQGANGAGAFSFSGGAAIRSGNLSSSEAENVDGDLVFVDHHGGEIDDYLRWASRKTLQEAASLGRAGAVTQDELCGHVRALRTTLNCGTVSQDGYMNFELCNLADVVDHSCSPDEQPPPFMVLPEPKPLDPIIMY